MRTKSIIILLLVLIGGILLIQMVKNIVPEGTHKFEAHAGEFYIDRKPTLLISGEMHFGRVLPEDWETRIKQAKAMGLNTVSFYLFWNLCEPREGEFTFKGMTDVRRMLELCQKHGLWAILRPGPYCCAEFEYGGIPWWTAKYPDVPIRSTHPKWLEWCRRYIEQLYAQIGDLQITKGGPLLMVQMDNEHGMISGGNESYMVEMKKIFRNAGFDTLLFTCDPGRSAISDELKGVLRGHNGYKGKALSGNKETGSSEGKNGVQFPIFVPELYTNWFTGWGMPLATKHSSVDEVLNWTKALIDERASFNYYMFYGGTTFGFYNGCNEYLPVHTSYDYSAPIDEAGRRTEKYRDLRMLIIKKLNLKLPVPPDDPPVIEIPAITLHDRQPLIDKLPSEPTLIADKPATMEELDQAYGFVLYRKSFTDGLQGTLRLNQPMDYAIVMVNGKSIGRAFRGYGEDSYTIKLPETHGVVTLDILVYNLGRISVITAPWTQNRALKGLTGGALINGNEIKGWEMYSLPFEAVSEINPSRDSVHTGPTFYQGNFAIDEVGGTFLDMSNWGMGVVWVNGHNLGRFWDRGALRSLFVPRHWLKKGKNRIVILELHDAPEKAEITGVKQIVTTEPRPFNVRLDHPPRFFPPAEDKNDYPGFTRIQLPKMLN